MLFQSEDKGYCIAPEVPQGEPEEEGYADVHNGPVAIDVGEVPLVADDIAIDAESGEAAQLPKGVPAPPEPSPVVRRRHKLTHMPYQSWCPQCVEGRRNNTAHRAIKDRSRTCPCLVIDYCFLRDSRDEDLITTAVGKFEPSQAVFACASNANGG